MIIRPLMLIVIVFALLLLISAPVLAEDANAAAVESAEPGTAAALEQLQTYLDKTFSMTAKFQSIVIDADGSEVADSASRGTVFIKRPGRFRWEYETPSPFIVLADGVDFWTYDEDMEQAVVRKLADYRGANPTLLLGADANVSDEFVVLSSWEVEGIPWLELAPKDDTSDFVKVRLSFKDDAIHLMELIDRVDKTSRIVFSEVKLNSVVDDSQFKFVVPEGVDVMGKPSQPASDSD